MKSLCISLMMILSAACVTYADEEILLDQKSLLTSLQMNREMVRSGRVTFSGALRTFERQNDHSQENAAQEPKSIIEGDIKGLLVFDGRDRMRFEWSEPGMVVDISSVKVVDQATGEVDASSTAGRHDRFFVQNGNSSWMWQSGFHSILKEPSAELIPRCGLFDWRSLGLYTWVEFDNCMTVDKIVDALIKRPAKSIHRDGAGRATIVWDFSDSIMSTEFEVSIDEAHAFTVTSCKMRERHKVSIADWQTTQESHVTWKEQDGITVPTEYELLVRPADGTFEKRLTFGMNWESMGSKIPDDEFSLSKIPAPKHVGLIDSTSGEQLIVHSPSVPKEMMDELIRKRYPEKPSSWTPFRLTLLLVNVVVILLAYFLWRRAK